ncbi:MAG: hypothetical protein R3C68_12655 [Myxococcota bacterium]
MKEATPQRATTYSPIPKFADSANNVSSPCRQRRHRCRHQRWSQGVTTDRDNKNTSPKWCLRLIGAFQYGPSDTNPLPPPPPAFVTTSLGNSETLVAHSQDSAPTIVPRIFGMAAQNQAVGAPLVSAAQTKVWVEFDLGQLHTTSARLFGNWVSTSWTLQTKRNINDP